jgi:phosphoribosylanthranilate isomerase
VKAEPTVQGLWIKICGVTSVAEAEMVAAAGADAIGLNFVPSSKRRVSAQTAIEIVRAVGGRVEWVGVFANQPAEELQRLAEEVGLDRLQLHGGELPDALETLGQRAYKALRVAVSEDLLAAVEFPGDRLLLDSKVVGELGGTGHAFDWRLAERLARQRPLVVAGGLTEHNVADAVRALRPLGVDTASGVEKSPGVKDPQRTALFIERARKAHAEVAGQGPAG